MPRCAAFWGMSLARPVCKTIKSEKTGDSGSGRVLRRHVIRLPQRNTDAAPLWRPPRLATYRLPAMASPTPADLVILSTRVVTPGGTAPAAVAISDGVVTAIHDHGAGPDSPRRLDVGDAVLLPGGVDTHVHVNERSEEHTSELQSHHDLVCRLLLEKKKK